MWNSAKLASGANAPITTVRHWLTSVVSGRSAVRSSVSYILLIAADATMRSRAKSATTLIANATKNG